MKCVVCKQLGLRSRLYDRGGSRTLVAARNAAFHDEEGHAHHHPASVYTGLYQCSKGHAYEQKSKLECPAPNCSAGGVISIRVILPKGFVLEETDGKEKKEATPHQ